LGVAVAGFFNRHFSQPAGVRARGRRRRFDNRIHLLLGIAPVFEGGLIGLVDLGADLLNGQEIFIASMARYFFRPLVGRAFSTSSCGLGMT